MARLPLFLIVFIALQGCNGEFLQQPKLDESEQFIQEYVDAMKEIQEIIHLVSKNLTSVIGHYEYEFGRVVDSHPTYPIIVDIRRIISKLEESESTDKNQECFRDARSTVITITEFIKKGVDNCIDNAHLLSDTIERQLEKVEEKAMNVFNVLIVGFYKCSSRDVDGKCLKDIFATIEKELEEVRVEVNTIQNTIHGQFYDEIMNLNMCMQKVQDSIISRGRSTIGNLNDCIKSMTL